MSIRVVTVFGGTGFLGRSVVRHLRKHEFSVRIVSRHPDRSRKLFGSDDPYLRSVEVDTRDERMVADVLAGAYAAVNAVSLYVERGQETFHSVHVEAAERVAVVAEAIARALQRTQTHAITFECGGPCVYSYEELLRVLVRKANLKCSLIPLPFAAWRALAWTAELLPNPPVTRNQVELMQVDNVCSPGVLGFAELGISPHSVENMLEQTLRSR